VPDLLAAIDETERIAQAATDGPWLAVGERDEVGVDVVPTDRTGSYVVCPDPNAGMIPADAEHIARHDPAAVLRRCAADREIVDLYRATQTALEAAQGTVLAGACKVRLGAYENVLRALAEGYGLTAEGEQ
jgi:hypothetical protein